jgi:hypothetical protein
MSEMVDRVAQELFHGRPAGRLEEYSWDTLTSDWHAAFRDTARVAIAAMREPTEEMLNAPREAYVFAGDFPMSQQEAVDAWRAMIDEALK